MGGEVNQMRGLLVALVALAVGAGCGSVPQGGAPTGDYRLYVAASRANASMVAIIDSKTHHELGQLPLGTASADWKHYYTVSGNDLQVTDPQTGLVVGTLKLARPYRLPTAALIGMPGGLSQNGRWLALETPPASPALESHLLVVDTTFAQQPVAIDLPGDFRFDAISNDGLRLYLIQYRSDSHYFVRFYDLGTHQLDPTIIFDKSDGSAAMTGVRLSGVADPSGQWLYSVYARKDKSAFIHMLSLDSTPIAFCIDLPGSGYATDASAFSWSLALNGTGTRLYAVNRATGVVLEVNIVGNSAPAVGRTAHISVPAQTAGIGVQTVQAKEIGAGAAAVSPDGRTLVVAGEAGITWVDTGLLRVRSTTLDKWNVWSLALSPDGSLVYALRDSGSIAEVSMKDGTVKTSFDSSLGQPLALMWVQAIT
jgi:hypothetical protein